MTRGIGVAIKLDPVHTATCHCGACRFNATTAKDYFRTKCASTPIIAAAPTRQYGYKVGCLTGVNPFELVDIPVKDASTIPPADS